jgi:beta-lactamase regulating signal transducer with metallopeptidase domain
MIGAAALHLWQSTVFAVAVAIVTLAFRGHRANVRYWLWLSASLKFLAPFAVLRDLGSRIHWTPVARPIVIPEVFVPVERVIAPFSVAVAPTAPAPVHDWKPAMLLAVWTCGAAAILLIRWRGWRRVRAAVRASSHMNIALDVEVRSAPGLLEPGVVGWMRPILLLPAGIEERLTGSQLESVLAHELCHVRRRDNLFASIHMLVEAAVWFHPLVWWIGARLVEERERSCDEAVLGLGSDPGIYAAAIVSVCRLYVESPLVCVSGVTGANLKRRIEVIMANRKGKSLNRFQKLLLAGAAIAVVAVPVAVGVVIRVGHPPAIHAQSPVAPATPQTVVPQVNAAPQRSTPAAPNPYGGKRLVAALFDFAGMTAQEQANVRQAAVNFVQTKLTPTDLCAILLADNGAVRVIHDFTADKAALESVIGQLSGSGMPGNGLSSIQAAAQVLSGLPQKKALIYFAHGAEQAAGDRAALDRTIQAAVAANLAIYNIDSLGLTPPPAPAGPQEESDRRKAEALQKFGSLSNAMARIYIRYGPPDQIDDRGANGQTWRYHYLQNLRGSAEFEFTGGDSPVALRVKWPPPLATYEGVPAADVPSPREFATEQAVAGLPGRHATLGVYPPGELQVLTVPLESFSGKIDIVGMLRRATVSGAPGNMVAAVRDTIQADSGTYQANFTLLAGSYVCEVVVRERSTGRKYGETIRFEVK